MLDRLKADEDAWAHWQSRTPNSRRQTTRWVVSAKRPETRERRFTALLTDAAAGRDPQPIQVSREQRAAHSRGVDR